MPNSNLNFYIISASYGHENGTLCSLAHGQDPNVDISCCEYKICSGEWPDLLMSCDGKIIKKDKSFKRYLNRCTCEYSTIKFIR